MMAALEKRKALSDRFEESAIRYFCLIRRLRGVVSLFVPPPLQKTSRLALELQLAFGVILEVAPLSRPIHL